MNKRIFDIDIICGSVRSGTIQSHYALTRIKRGIVIFEEKMSLSLDLCAIFTPNIQKLSQLTMLPDFSPQRI